jgi:hypothetical protein
MLLIYPPVARSTEPPLGIARIASCLKAAGGEAECVDLNGEGIGYLLGLEAAAEERRDSGSLRRRWRAAESLRAPAGYSNESRYARAVDDLGRALKLASAPFGAEASLADYRDLRLSPLRIADLLESAARFRENAFYPLFERRLPDCLVRARDGWAGVSIGFLSQALCAFALIGCIKSIRPDLKVAIGGGLVTSWLACGLISPGETFGGLVEAAFAGPGERSLARLLGLDADKRPAQCPALEDFPDRSYFAPTRIVPYNFSFGCPWKRCTFCPERAENMPYEGMPAAEAAAMLERLRERYEPGLFHFMDSEIATPYLEALASSKAATPWYGFARFSTRLLDRGFCRALAASGCVMLQLGLESGDQRLLDALGKGTKIDEIAAILDNLAEAGIGAYAYVLFGTPEEDRDSALRTRDFVALRADRIDFLNVAVFNLPATSLEAQRLETRSFFEGDLTLYKEFSHPSGWDRAAVRRFLAEDFESVPEIRAIVNRTPPVFSSNHAPFFLEPMKSMLKGP